MPNIIVKVPEGVFDQTARDALAKGVHAAAKAVEQFGDDPRQEILTWVMIEEIKPGCLYAGAADPLSRLIPVSVFFNIPAGVIGAEARSEAVRLIHEAVDSAKPAADPRLLATSVIMHEVSDGTWGASGDLWFLPDFARATGYAHLQHLVPEATAEPALASGG